MLLALFCIVFYQLCDTSFMKKCMVLICLCLAFGLTVAPQHCPRCLPHAQATTAAQTTAYTVKAGDSLWKIAVRFEIGISELIAANPQIKNPALIWVGQRITIPNATPLNALEDEIVRLVNVQRSYHGLGPLLQNWQASRVARYKSEDMILKNYFAHISPTYGSPFVMMESFGLKFSAAAENIAYGQTSAKAVIDSWMNSPGHKANILSKSFTHIGVGAAKKANGTLYFTQLFLKPIG